MSKTLIITVLIVLALIAGTVFSMRLSYRNTERELRNSFVTQRKAAEAAHDKMRKTIFQKAGITSEYADRFEKIFPALIAGRYQGKGDGSLMKFVVEANPTFDTSLYKDLQQSVEAERAAFLNVQREVLGVEQQYNTFIVMEPGSWFLPATTKELHYKVVSSAYTQQVMESGQDNEVELFPKAKPAADSSGK
jgi:hypothetical protein